MTHSPEDSTYFQQSVFNEDVWFYGNVYGLENANIGITSIVQNNSNVTVQSNETITVTTNSVGIVTFTQNNIGIANTLTLERTGIVQKLFENVNVSSTALTGTINLDILSGTLFYYTADASGNWTFNIRGNSSTTLNSILPIGKSVTITVLSTQGSTARYASGFTVDGSSVSPKWQGGTAPSTGYTSSINVYTYSIVKTADATFTVLNSATINGPWTSALGRTLNGTPLQNNLSPVTVTTVTVGLVNTTIVVSCQSQTVAYPTGATGLTRYAHAAGEAPVLVPS